MSRIGRMPVEVPQGVDIEIKGSHVRVKGPKGQLEHTFPAAMDISMDAGQITVQCRAERSRQRDTSSGRCRVCPYKDAPGGVQPPGDPD